MPSGPRQTTRPGAGPGRGRPRAASRRPASGVRRPTESPGILAESASTDTPPPRKRRSSITSRAIALAVVLLVLTISYASSLRIYLAQSSEISATQAEISDRQATIESLQAQLGQWEDPAYVKQQARDRLGWVVPGEIGYRVVGPDGKPLGGGAELDQPAPAPTKPVAWWQKLWGSVETADRPAPAKKSTKPSQQKPITAKTTPSASPHRR